MHSGLRLICVHPAGDLLGRAWLAQGIEHRGDHAIDMGRSNATDIPIHQPTFGRRHCRFRLSSGAWTVHHLGSTNGTRVYRDQRDARSGSDAVDAGRDVFGAPLVSGAIVNPADHFFRVVLADDNDPASMARADDSIARLRLRLRIVDWLTGALRPDAFAATLPWLEDAALLRVDFNPPHVDPMDWGEPWLWSAATLIRTYAGRDSIVGFAPPARFAVATTDAEPVAATIEKAFRGPWRRANSGELARTAVVTRVERADDALPTSPLPEALSTIALPRCLECAGALHVAESRESIELFVCTACGGMFELDALAAAQSVS